MSASLQPVFQIHLRWCHICILQVAFPGAYRCVCVRLKLSHLAVAAIIKVWQLLLPGLLSAPCGTLALYLHTSHWQSQPSRKSTTSDAAYRSKTTATRPESMPALWHAPGKIVHPRVVCMDCWAQADLIGELEGAGGAPDTDGCGPAFKVLRQLAQRLLTDAAERHNRCCRSRLFVPLCLFGAQHACSRGQPAFPQEIVRALQGALCHVISL